MLFRSGGSGGAASRHCRNWRKQWNKINWKAKKNSKNGTKILILKAAAVVKIVLLLPRGQRGKEAEVGWNSLS